MVALRSEYMYGDDDPTLWSWTLYLTLVETLGDDPEW